MKYVCTLPNFTSLDKKFNIQPFVTDKKDTCYAHTIGILKGQIRVRDNKIIKNTYQEDKTLQELRKIPGIIEHYITQCIDDQLEAMVLICVPYTPETSSLWIPTCYQEAKYAHIKVEITLIDDTLTRIFTIGLHNRNLDIIGLVHDTFDWWDMDAIELEEWRNEIELTESDSILFHLVPETMEYESGVAVDFYDEIGNQIIATYKSGEDILEHIQNIRVIEVTYES